MDSIETLPDAVVRPGTPVADECLVRGLATFRLACQWVKDLPYGANSRMDTSLILFEERRGTCFTKHGAMARLAEELRLEVYKNLGFYRLNEDIITGASDILRPHGLDFVPSIHCFLEYGTNRVDLTEGNSTGKNKDLDEFDFVVRVRPESSRDELQRHYADFFANYSSLEPRLAAFGLSGVGELVRACHQLASCRCAATAGPATVTVGRVSPSDSQPETFA